MFKGKRGGRSTNYDSITKSKADEEKQKTVGSEDPPFYIDDRNIPGTAAAKAAVSDLEYKYCLSKYDKEKCKCMVRDSKGRLVNPGCHFDIFKPSNGKKNYTPKNYRGVTIANSEGVSWGKPYTSQPDGGFTGWKNPAERLGRLGRRTTNAWGMPSGAGGEDVEMFYEWEPGQNPKGAQGLLYENPTTTNNRYDYNRKVEGRHPFVSDSTNSIENSVGPAGQREGVFITVEGNGSGSGTKGWEVFARSIFTPAGKGVMPSTYNRNDHSSKTAWLHGDDTTGGSVVGVNQLTAVSYKDGNSGLNNIISGHKTKGGIYSDFVDMLPVLKGDDPGKKYNNSEHHFEGRRDFMGMGGNHQGQIKSFSVGGHSWTVNEFKVPFCTLPMTATHVDGTTQTWTNRVPLQVAKDHTHGFAPRQHMPYNKYGDVHWHGHQGESPLHSETKHVCSAFGPNLEKMARAGADAYNETYTNITDVAKNLNVTSGRNSVQEEYEVWRCDKEIDTFEKNQLEFVKEAQNAVFDLNLQKNNWEKEEIGILKDISGIRGEIGKLLLDISGDDGYDRLLADMSGRYDSLFNICQNDLESLGDFGYTDKSDGVEYKSQDYNFTGGFNYSKKGSGTSKSSAKLGRTFETQELEDGIKLPGMDVNNVSGKNNPFFTLP